MDPIGCTLHYCAFIITPGVFNCGRIYQVVGVEGRIYLRLFSLDDSFNITSVDLTAVIGFTVALGSYKLASGVFSLSQKVALVMREFKDGLDVVALE